jgi:hypothetical protein
MIETNSCSPDALGLFYKKIISNRRSRIPNSKPLASPVHPALQIMFQPLFSTPCSVNKSGRKSAATLRI